MRRRDASTVFRLPRKDRGFYHSSSSPAPSGCTRIQSVSTLPRVLPNEIHWITTVAFVATLSREMQLRNGNRTNGIEGCRLDSCASKSRRVWKSPPFLRQRQLLRISLQSGEVTPTRGFIKHPIYVYLRREVAMLKTSNYGSLRILRRNWVKSWWLPTRLIILQLRYR